MKLAVLSNINIQMLSGAVSTEPEYDLCEIPGYDSWQPLLLDQESSLYQSKPEIIFIILDGLELITAQKTLEDKKNELSNNIHLINQIVHSKPDIQFFVANMDLYDHALSPLQSQDNTTELEFFWEENLHQVRKTVNNLSVFNIKKIIYKMGGDAFYSAKLWYLAKQKYSINAIENLKNEIINTLNAYAGKKKKCLILDLDNTLWGGIVAEEGVYGIELSEHKEGARFKDFQRKIKQLKSLGIILAICSKNNSEEVKAVFEENKEMVLNEDDFSCQKINWESKVDNIQAIANELNIGLDSMVFIDDNPVERGLVKEFLPMVEVAKFPKDTVKLPALIEELYHHYFLVYQVTQTDTNKTNLYQANQKRTAEKQQHIDLSSFLSSLDTVISIDDFQESELERVYSLIQKSNQFNLTTQRYSRNDIIFLDQHQDILFYTANVKDKFGDNGLVVILVIKLDEINKTALIDNFIMSCRIMGRYIEDQIMNFVSEKLINLGYLLLQSYYIKTKKNKPVASLYDRLGFELISESSDKKNYQYDLKQSLKNHQYATLVDESQ